MKKYPKLTIKSTTNSGALAKITASVHDAASIGNGAEASVLIRKIILSDQLDLHEIGLKPIRQFGTTMLYQDAFAMKLSTFETISEFVQTSKSIMLI
jgi:hypothetical protein